MSRELVLIVIVELPILIGSETTSGGSA